MIFFLKAIYFWNVKDVKVFYVRETDESEKVNIDI